MSDTNDNNPLDQRPHASDYERAVLSLTNIALGLARHPTETENIINSLARVNAVSTSNCLPSVQLPHLPRSTPNSRVSSTEPVTSNASFQPQSTPDPVAPDSLSTHHVQTVTLNTNDKDDSFDDDAASCTPVPSQSVYFKKWVSQGRLIDVHASQNPQNYPDGDVILEYDNVTAKPLVSWASQQNGKKGKKKYYCLGAWICPHFTICKHSLRATVPRRGNNKYSTGNKTSLPPQCKWCPSHPDSEPILLPCTCTWTIVDVSSNGTNWKLSHQGSHDHPAPEPKHATTKGRAWVDNVVSVHPDITTTGLKLGKATRPAAKEVDIAFQNSGYLKSIRRKAREDASLRMTGLKSGTDSIDMSMEYVRQLSNRYDVLHVATLHGGASRSGQRHGPAFIFQGPNQRRDFLDSPYPHETDTIESLSDARYFLGKVDVTMTSGYSVKLGKQVPYMISVLPKRNESTYSVHWDWLFDPYHDLQFEDFQSFVDYYPGNTCDYSEGLLGGWKIAMNGFVQAEFKIPMLPEEEVGEMYGYCTKHYNSNVLKVSNISKYVDPEKRDEFILLAMALPTIESFVIFTEAVFVLVGAFPKVTPWICWYLHDKRRNIHFLALKKIKDFGKLKNLLKTTNGQEGLGGFLKNSAMEGQRTKLIGHVLMEHLASWMQTYEDELAFKGEGVQTEYKRWNRKKKQKFAEPKKKYKGPDSVKLMADCGKDVLRHHPRKDQFTHTIPNAAPPQLKNIASCCFANSLIQNVFACDPLNKAFLVPLATSASCVQMKKNPPQCEQYSLFQKALIKMNSMKEKPGILIPDDILAILRHWEADPFSSYKYGMNADPDEFFHYILAKLDNTGYCNHPLLNGNTLLSRVLTHRSCDCQQKSLDTIEGSTIVDPRVLTVYHHTVEGCSIVDCLNHRFRNRKSESTPTDNHVSTCTSAFVTEKHWFASLGDYPVKSLIISLVPRLADMNTFVDPTNIARPVMSIDLSPYMLPRSNSPQVKATLTGYISWKTTTDEYKNISSHFVSVTNSKINNHFYLSDDLTPANPRDLGTEINDGWPNPTWLYYTVEEVCVPFLSTALSAMTSKETPTFTPNNKPIITILKRNTNETRNGNASDDSAIIECLGVDRQRQIDMKKMFCSVSIGLLSELGKLHSIVGDGNCGYVACMRGLDNTGGTKQCSVTAFRSKIYRYICKRRLMDPPLTETITDVDNRTVGQYTFSPTEDEGCVYRKNWLSKVWQEGSTFENGASMCHWFDSHPLLGVMALLFQQSFVTYNQELKNTAIYFYDRHLDKVLFCAQDGYYSPPAGSVCIVFNGSNHYEFLELQGKYMTINKNNPREMRMLRVGDIIEYRKQDRKLKKRKKGCTIKSKTSQTTIEKISPGNNKMTLQLEDGFFMSKTHSTYQIRKIETTKQSGTSWGYIDSYFLLCIPTRNVRHKRNKQKSTEVIQFEADADVSGISKEVFIRNQLESDEDISGKSKEVLIQNLKDEISMKYQDYNKEKDESSESQQEKEQHHKSKKTKQKKKTTRESKKKKKINKKEQEARNDIMLLNYDENRSVDSPETINSFSLGYKFKQKVHNAHGVEEWVVGTVIEIGDRANDRLVKYSEGTELLSVDDLKDHPAVARFEHYLRVGDVIEYIPYISPSQSKTVSATIVEIGDPIFHSDQFSITTTRPYDSITNANPTFRLVRSEHDDSPPLNIWTSIERVNLVRGKVDEETKAKYVKERDKLLHHVLHETPGAEVALLMLAIDEDRTRSKPTMTRSMTARPIGTFKYEIGTAVRKEWNGKLYSGEVMSCGVDGDKNTYDIYYAEDGDREILFEEELEDIVVKTCNTIKSK